MSLAIYFTSYVLNMFRTLIYPSSGACDCAVELSHWSRTPLKPSLTKSATHSKTTKRPMDNSTAESQAPDDGYINVRNMLST